jgi:putative ubiquitin-RnfH superfamily antitoxin RatB of RatAB toxin-antitoxin module
MSEAGARSKRCWVAYATRDRQYLWELELPVAASVEEALRAARRAAESEGESAAIPWEKAPVGIFGEPCDRSATPREGDRIELYRPLTNDPKQARRERARRR